MNNNPGSGLVAAFESQNVPLSDIVPTSTMSISDRNNYRLDSIRRAIARAKEKGVINADGSNAVIREIRPTADLTFGANANQDWLTAAMVAGTLLTVVNNRQVPQNQLFVIYGISCIEAAPAVGEVTIARGTAGAGGINLIVNLQSLYDKLEQEAYFSKAVLYDPTDIIFIQFLPVAAAAGGQRYILHGYVVEPVGTTFAVQPA